MYVFKQNVLTNLCHNDLVTKSAVSYPNLAVLLRPGPLQRLAELQVPHGKTRASSGVGGSACCMRRRGFQPS